MVEHDFFPRLRRVGAADDRACLSDLETMNKLAVVQALVFDYKELPSDEQQSLAQRTQACGEEVAMLK